jgi:beta-glucosidase
VFLGTGETTTVRFAIRRSDLEFYDILSHDWKAEPGTFTVYIGSSSRDIRQVGKFALTY